MIEIAIAGDFVDSNRMQLYTKHRYEEILGETKVMFQNFDYRIINLENPVASKEAKPITKCGPALRCGDNAIDMLAYGGFDCATLANNHFYDYGETGVEATINSLDRRHIDHVGGGRNLDEASTTLYKQIKGKTLAFINCTEHEFSIATPNSGGCNPLDPIRQYHAIQEARSKADHVLVITHGGIEDYSLPTPRMQETYRFFIEIGADAVVNHHQHCPSGYEVYQGKPIFYGLGNFFLDKPNHKDLPWNKGYVVGLLFDNDDIRFNLYPYLQCNGELGVKFLDDIKRKDFLEEIDRLNTIISNPKQIIDAHEQLMESTSSYLRLMFTPYSTKLTEVLFDKGLLPFYYPHNKWPMILNRIECESHRERLIHYIKKQMK